jgi:hypothetical protein
MRNMKLQMPDVPAPSFREHWWQTTVEVLHKRGSYFPALQESILEAVKNLQLSTPRPHRQVKILPLAPHFVAVLRRGEMAII